MKRNSWNLRNSSKVSCNHWFLIWSHSLHRSLPHAASLLVSPAAPSSSRQDPVLTNLPYIRGSCSFSNPHRTTKERKREIRERYRSGERGDKRLVFSWCCLSGGIFRVFFSCCCYCWCCRCGAALVVGEKSWKNGVCLGGGLLVATGF